MMIEIKEEYKPVPGEKKENKKKKLKLEANAKDFKEYLLDFGYDYWFFFIEAHIKTFHPFGGLLQRLKTPDFT